MRRPPVPRALFLALLLSGCGLRMVRPLPPEAPSGGQEPWVGAMPPAAAAPRHAWDDPSATPPPAWDACEDDLARAGVRFAAAPPTPGVARPVVIEGPIHGLRLVPLAGRPPLMDCEMARALLEMAPLFLELGIDELRFSAAYAVRVRRGTSRLSTHAAGLALDVHELRGPAGRLEIARDFEAGVGRWRALRRGDSLEGCVGAPRTSEGRTLRLLVCRLKLDGAPRIVATPDDDADHRDHLHIEAPRDVVRRRQG